MKKKIWFMEGLSSQRDIILGVKSFAEKENQNIVVFSSHRNERNEILSVSDFSMIEPKTKKNVFLLFIPLLTLMVLMRYILVATVNGLKATGKTFNVLVST
jgi:hypothetical protein